MSATSKVWGKAERRIRGGRLTEAVDILAPHLQQHPNDVYAWELMAAAELELGEWGRAEEAARRVLEIGAPSARGLSNWGTTLRKLGRLGEAREAQQEALGLEPGYPRALEELEKVRRAEEGHAPDGLRLSRRQLVGAALVLAGVIGVALAVVALQSKERPADPRAAAVQTAEGAEVEPAGRTLQWPPAPAPGAGAVAARVLEVTRPDVLVVDAGGQRQTVRLHGIETPGLGPEVVSVCEAFTRLLAPPGAMVTVGWTGRDRRGRTTAQVYPRLGAPSVSAVALVAGYAWYDREDFPTDAFSAVAASFARDHGWGLNDPATGEARWTPPQPKQLAQECGRAIWVLREMCPHSGEGPGHNSSCETLISIAHERSKSVITLTQQAARNRDRLRAEEENAYRQARWQETRERREEERQAESGARAAADLAAAVWIAEHTCRACDAKGWRLCGWCNATGIDPDTGHRCLVCGGKGFYDCPACVNGITD